MWYFFECVVVVVIWRKRWTITFECSTVNRIRYTFYHDFSSVSLLCISLPAIWHRTRFQSYLSTFIWHCCIFVLLRIFLSKDTDFSIWWSWTFYVEGIDNPFKILRHTVRIYVTTLFKNKQKNRFLILRKRSLLSEVFLSYVFFFLLNNSDFLFPLELNASVCDAIQWIVVLILSFRKEPIDLR